MRKWRRSLFSGPPCVVVFLPLLPGNAWAFFDCTFDCVDPESGAAFGRGNIRSGVLPVTRPADGHEAERIALLGATSRNTLDPVVALVNGDSAGELSFSLHRRTCGTMGVSDISETLDWMLLPTGRGLNGGGDPYETGVTPLVSGWTQVNFTEEFPNPPVVILSPGSSVDTFAVPRLGRVNSTGFWALLQGHGGGQPFVGTISWLALPMGTSTLMNVKYEARLQQHPLLTHELPSASPLVFATVHTDVDERPAYFHLLCMKGPTYTGINAKPAQCGGELDEGNTFSVLIMQPPEGLSLPLRDTRGCEEVTPMLKTASFVLSILFWGAPCVGCVMRGTKFRRKVWLAVVFVTGVVTLVYWLWLEPTDGYTWRQRMHVDAWGFLGFVIALGVGMLANILVRLYRWRKRRQREQQLEAKASTKEVAEEEATADAEVDAEKATANTETNTRGAERNNEDPNEGDGRPPVFIDPRTRL